LVGSTAAWPLAARAQQPAMPVIGFLHGGSPEPNGFLVAGFRRGLGDTGYIEGQNVAVEYRWARNQVDQLPLLASELVKQQANVICAGGGDITARSAKAATTTIPIIFLVGSDPIQLGLVDSLNRPTGNLTGITQLTTSLEPKRLELLREVMPSASVIGALINPTRLDAEIQLRGVQDAAVAVGQQVEILNASNDQEIEKAFDRVVSGRIGGLLVGSDVFFAQRRQKLVLLAARHAVPAVYQWREYTDIGGLMSYGTNLPDAYRQGGIYAGRILKGAKPSDLPVQQSTKVELVLNLNTAKILGITFPLSLLGRADEVIE
jgi:putative ABC transport system substrate-binding protein